MSAEAKVITGARVLVGEGLEPVDEAGVVVEDGRISDLGPSAAVPDDADVIDASGFTLLPGFIDAHVHIGFYDPHFLVAGGVTTARDLGWPPRFIHELVARSRTHELEGPLLLAAGPMLTVPHGYPTRASWAPPGTGRPVRSPDEATEAVVRTADEGADVIKVALNPAAGPTLDRETLEAIVARAHELGLQVTGHVYGLAELDKALDAGMDELAHMLMSAERIPDETIERMVGQGMTVVPTLSIRFGRDQEIAVDNVARFVSSGGRIVYGTDLGNEGPKPGIDRREIGAMQRTGMSGRDIIASATVHAARYLKLESKGVVAPGMDADLVAVAGDPLSDIRALTRVKLVWREGRRVL